MVFKKIWEQVGMNPLDRLLKAAMKEGKNRFLIVWNRGLGDIPLGLYALIYRIRSFIPHASITFLTRKDLKECFTMLKDVHVLVDLHWERGKPTDIEESLQKQQLSPQLFDVILKNPNPTQWLKWQLGSLTPRLRWEKEWDTLSHTFGLKKGQPYIGAHVQTETDQYYRYEKNWKIESWHSLFTHITEEKKAKVLLFGLKPLVSFMTNDVIDLRGKTSFVSLLSLIKNYCTSLVAPDSGILSTLYYLDVNFPIRVVSLWADPKQGILRQGVASPNPQLVHFPLVGKQHRISNITVDEVLHALFR